MKITLLADDAIRYEATTGPLTIDAPTADTEYSPYHMLASALATCTFSVLASWAEHAKLAIDDLVIEVRWQFVDRPHRVGSMTLDFRWPSLPAARLEAARRAAALCPVHATLSHPPALTITGTAGADGAAGTGAPPGAATAGSAATEVA